MQGKQGEEEDEETEKVQDAAKPPDEMEATGLSEAVHARLMQIVAEGKCARKDFDGQTLVVRVTFPFGRFTK